MQGRTRLLLLLILLLAFGHGHAGLAVQEEEERRDGAPTAANSPRIALVLSGGGARGAAHLGVIRVLEELRVPVDMIIGTSGGAIIGGLYASGWSPEEIAEWLEEMDWNVALSDGLPRRDLPYRDKQDDERFLFNLEIGIGRDTVSLPKALIDGRNLAFLLEQATSRVAGVRDFDHLPIPFRAIATDLENADKVTLSSGRLSHAIRASMSVPGVFSPVSADDRLLVDGGLVDNLPIETALDMGADIIIAVNAGSQLQEREALGNIFALSVQVSALITYKNTQQSMALLEDRDVLIEPDLGDMGSQEFGRSLEAAAMGEAAARALREQLTGLSVDTDRFQAFLAGQRREKNDLGMVLALRVTGLERLSERRITALIQTREGEELALDRLQSDLGRLQRLSEIEAVDFQIVEREGGVELELEVRERQEGPHRFRLGLEMFDEFDGGARYNIRLGHTLPSLNRLGAEWRSEFQMGHSRAARSEFYQPLSAAGRYFLSLPVSYGSKPTSVYADGNRLAEFAVREGRGGLDVGAGVGAHGELRLGAWWNRISSEQRIGGFESGDYAIENSGLRLLFNYDRLDDAEWPTEGQYFRAEVEESRPAMGADQAYLREHYQMSQFWHRGAHRFMLSGEWGQLDTALPFQQQFQLGGPFSLAGYRQGELRGDRIAATRAVWFRRLGKAGGVGRAGEMFVGAGLASGAAWQHGEGSPSDDIVYGGQLFLAAGTPLGPVIVGMTQSDAGRTGYFLALGLPIYRPEPVASPW